MTVVNPGMWSQNHLEAEDYGFPEVAERPARPRLRLVGTIIATVLGIALAGATAVGFVGLIDFALTDLLGVLAENAG